MKIVMIIAQEGYQEHEYGAPKKIIIEAGHEVITASKKIGACKGSLDGIVKATVSIDELNVSDYDAVIFVGGPGARSFINDVQAHLTAQEAINRGKVLGAICLAPVILARAGVLEGKKATVYDNEGVNQKELEQQGATYTGEAVTVDGKIVTANGPPAAEEFGRKIVELLKN